MQRLTETSARPRMIPHRDVVAFSDVAQASVGTGIWPAGTWRCYQRGYRQRRHLDGMHVTT